MVAVAAASVLVAVAGDKSLQENFADEQVVREAASDNVSATYVAEGGIHMHAAGGVDEKMRTAGEELP